MVAIRVRAGLGAGGVYRGNPPAVLFSFVRPLARASRAGDARHVRSPRVRPRRSCVARVACSRVARNGGATRASRKPARQAKPARAARKGRQGRQGKPSPPRRWDGPQGGQAARRTRHPRAGTPLRRPKQTRVATLASDGAKRSGGKARRGKGTGSTREIDAPGHSTGAGGRRGNRCSCHKLATPWRQHWPRYAH